MVPANITLCLLPERGGAGGQGTVIHGVPGDAVPGGSPDTNEPPRAQAGNTLQGFSLLETGDLRVCFSSPQDLMAKTSGKKTNDNFFFWMVAPNAHLTPFILPNDPQGPAGAGQGCCPKEDMPSIPRSQRGKEEVHHFDVIQLLMCV